MASGYKTRSKKRVAILVTIITLLVLFLFVFPTGSGRLTDGGITVYLFDQEIYDNSYTAEVPIDS